MNFKSNSSLHNTAFRNERKILKWIHFSRCSQSFTKNLIGFIHTVDAGVHRYFVKLKEWMVQVDLKLSSVCRQHIQYTDWTIKWKWVIHATPTLRRDLVKISTRKLWHTLSFSLECFDFKNVTFEKISWAPSEVAEVKIGRTVKERDLESMFSLNLSLKEVWCSTIDSFAFAHTILGSI